MGISMKKKLMKLYNAAREREETIPKRILFAHLIHRSLKKYISYDNIQYKNTFLQKYKGSENTIDITKHEQLQK